MSNGSGEILLLRRTENILELEHSVREEGDSHVELDLIQKI